ncbi:MAG: TRAP transporter small permease [Acetobacteraceae bacterium]|nr:TRAP transporter small permease [Acetobacteraceae bacterium]MCX7683793.1 TRAP transporter small permease [Acetobacteraceae bacterium]MDW8398928.1 TRAP transporter small permease [Acetobacteraceae bacterium]
MIRWLDRATGAAGAAGALCFAALLLVMLFEVASRYLLGRPTIWSTETAALLNGAGFLLAAGLALRQGAHVGIDVLAARLPQRLRDGVLALFLLAVFLPLLLWVLEAAAARAWSAFLTGEVDDVSPWRRPIWPKHAALAAGLFCFAVSVLAEGVRAGARAVRRHG